MARKLKIFRTAIGFHDAYVAAPSRKAALEAWGANADLFARGMAEEVTDDALTAEPLAHPGEVIKRTRGNMAAHIAALPKAAAPSRKGKKAKPTPPEPRPSRDALGQAEDALAAAEKSHEAARRDLAAREAALRRERSALEQRIETEQARLEDERKREEARYRRALDAWRG
ncbi:MAG: hypothetical protein ABW164_00785 [Sphingobium sp.]